MSDLLLPLLTVILAGLTIAGLLGLGWPSQAARCLRAGGALASLGAMLCLLALVLGSRPAMLILAIGFPDGAFRLVLEPDSAFFAGLAFGSGGAIAVATATRPDLCRAAAPLSLLLAAFGLAALAANALTQASGLALGGGFLWLLQAPHQPRPALAAIPLLAAACVAAAGHAPEPALVWLALLGPGALMGLVPLHRWLTSAAAGTEPILALLSGVAAPVTLTAMLRLLFHMPGAVPPGWWSLPFLLLGAASVATSGWQEARQTELGATLAAGAGRQTGVIAIGIGLALSARAADLPSVTAMALQAVLVLAAVQAFGGTLLALASGAIRHGAGTLAHDRLGGLAHRMPVTTACLLAGMFGLSALPPSAGFAALWLLFHAVLGLPHAAALPFRLLLCAVIAVLGLTAALNLASLLRLIGVACLGRPRTPRAAVAEEQSRFARLVAAGLAGIVLAWGVFAGPLLRLLGNGPLRALITAGPGPGATWLGLVPGPDSPGYAAMPLAVLVLLAAGAAALARRRLVAHTGIAVGAAWNHGFAAPPNWLPFGDPATQTTGVGFLPGSPWPSRSRLPTLRRAALPRLSAPALVLILAAVLLGLGAWLIPG